MALSLTDFGLAEGGGGRRSSQVLAKITPRAVLCVWKGVGLNLYKILIVLTLPCYYSRSRHSSFNSSWPAPFARCSDAQ